MRPFLLTICYICVLLLCACQSNSYYNANELDLNTAKKYNILAQNTRIWQVNRGFTSDSLNTIVDSAGLIKQLEKIPPNVSGIGLLDWEGEIEKGFEVGASETLFQKVLIAHFQVLRIAKKIRPNLKWSYYAFPITQFWQRDEFWRKQNNRLLPLLQECDILCPSMYLFYTNNEVEKSKNITYAKENTSEVLRLADKLNKKVYPLVWHRYHFSNTVNGLRLIPADQFKQHINDMLTVNENNKKINGIIWWGSDRYFYNVKSKALLEEVELFGSFEDYYYKKVIVVYSKLIQDELKKQKK